MSLQLPTPWMQILKSPHIWLIAIAQWGTSWCSTTLLTQGPTYFRRIHHWSMSMVGIFTGTPHLLGFVCSHLFTEIADHLIHRGFLSTTSVRKIATTLGSCVQGGFTIALANCGTMRHVSIVWFFFAVGVHGAITAGPLASLIDISPNFAGIAMGIITVFTTTTMFISPYVVSSFTLHHVSYYENAFSSKIIIFHLILF